jgi:NTE family protein
VDRAAFREVLYASPRNDKNIFIVENYPRKIQRLPSSMAEVSSRAKDIIFSDKNLLQDIFSL